MAADLLPCPEQWRDIPGYVGRYIVSNKGSVISVISGCVMLRPKVHSRGYREVHLTDVDGNASMHLVHRLVLSAFVGPCPDGCETRHLSGDKADNRLANLAYGTKTENADDRRRHGTDGKGERNSQAKLTEQQVRAIRWQRSLGQSLNLIGKQYGIDRKTVRQILAGERWSHVI